ncbi:uncharacterized protein LOC132628856 [Lycium barbarum]|uniref:uncharacterized protein LOC132628856 n=1 Tax=Lycium barbarum TaxID=112863 RepID=UPI00293F0016|nr:uncharacterized protein LOC132628856 [Lycium barbarum]
MRLVTWNVRGFNKLYKQREMVKFVRENNVHIIAIIEHRVNRKFAAKIVKKVFPGWTWADNYNSNDQGRIWMLWYLARVSVTIIQSQDQFIPSLVTVGTIQFLFTAIYGFHTAATRKSLWVELKKIHAGAQAHWVLMEDYNAITEVDDRVNGTEVQESELHLTNVSAMEPLFSDHSPLSLSIVEQRMVHHKPFKFYNYMADHEGFIEAVRGIEEKIDASRKKLTDIQLLIADGQHEHLVPEDKLARAEFEKWTNIEESIWRWLYTEQEIEKEICAFYGSLLGSKASSLPAIDPGVMKMGNVLDRADQMKLISRITADEVSKSWEITGKDITAAVLLFFQNHVLPTKINYTSVTLIPKVKNPVSVKEYRPISCCTVIYKLISKILTRRLQCVMAKLVENNQTAFVPGRLISDNIILSHELVKGYGRKNISPRCMLKIDMKKAYDSVEWPFLEQILISLNFPDQFVKWIMVCVSTVNYAIVINGKLSQTFPVKKGLRQGDHLSPFLFVLCMEYLNRVLKPLDDLLLFCRGDELSIYKVYECFLKFSAASVLIANTSKSSIYFGGVDMITQQTVLDKLQFSKGSLPFRYLRVPLSTKRLSVMQCMPLIDKIMGRVTHWTSKLLTYAGRLQLIKTIGDTVASKKALIAWEKLCLPKVAGGLYILHAQTWNKAAVCKLLWNLCRKADKLWVKWVHTYYIKNQSVWNYFPQQASWMLKKIFKATKTLELAGIDNEEFTAAPTFSIKQVYLKLRGCHQKVSWRKLICNNHGSPKWVFILYLALNRRLYTRDRLKKWGITNQVACPLCGTEPETIDHLFFQCSFSAAVWEKLLMWQGYQRKAMEWTNEVLWMCAQVNGKAAQSQVCRMVAAGSVYILWQERNNRVFQQRTPETLIRMIVQEVMVRGSLQPRLAYRMVQLDYYPI